MIKIIVVGKLKEKYLCDLVSDYEKRINKYHKLKLIEVKDSNIKEEAKEILKYINTKDFLITLNIVGNMLNSLEFADYMNNLLIKNSNITFIIGGSNGIDESLLNKSNYSLSFGKMTFPHGLFRGILLEQIYRSFKINNNESYHK